MPEILYSALADCRFDRAYRRRGERSEAGQPLGGPA